MRPLPWARTLGDLRFEPSRWSPHAFRLETSVGAHLILRRHGAAEVALWLPAHLAPRPRGLFGIYLHTDPHLIHRGRAAMQLRRAIGIGAPLRPMRHRDAHRLVAMLCVHDLTQAGHSLRAIADQILETIPPDWSTSSERSDLRRLVEAGQRMVDGGYRALLQPARPAFRKPI